jgi:hypothetical protein
MEGWVASPVQGHEIARMEALAEPVAPRALARMEALAEPVAPRALAEPMAPHSYSGTPEKEN